MQRALDNGYLTNLGWAQRHAELVTR